MGQLFMVSPDRLACYLGELSLDELLRSCEERAVSGQISVDCDGWPGTILLESGHTVNASYQNRVGSAAVSLMKQLRSGELELCRNQDSAQRSDEDERAGTPAGAPDQAPAGEPDGAIDALGDLIEISITAIMRHGEDSEMSGCVQLGNGVDTAEMHFALGSLNRIELIDHGPIDLSELVERFRQAGRPLTIGLDDDPIGWEGPTHVRPKARQDDNSPETPAEEPPLGIPYPVIDEMPTQPWQRPDEATMQVRLGARFVAARPWWQQPYTVPSAIAVTAALSCLLLGLFL